MLECLSTNFGSTTNLESLMYKVEYLEGDFHRYHHVHVHVHVHAHVYGHALHSMN